MRGGCVMYELDCAIVDVGGRLDMRTIRGSSDRMRIMSDRRSASVCAGSRARVRAGPYARTVCLLLTRVVRAVRCVRRARCARVELVRMLGCAVCMSECWMLVCGYSLRVSRDHDRQMRRAMRLFGSAVCAFAMDTAPVRHAARARYRCQTVCRMRAQRRRGCMSCLGGYQRLRLRRADSSRYACCASDRC